MTLDGIKNGGGGRGRVFVSVPEDGDGYNYI